MFIIYLSVMIHLTYLNVITYEYNKGLIENDDDSTHDPRRRLQYIRYRGMRSRRRYDSPHPY